MRILYHSVHQILEDDEVRLLQSLGHDVCSLGANSPSGATGAFRDAISFNLREREFYAAFTALGGSYTGISEALRIPAEFVDLFDLVIVMHGIDVIAAHWDALSRRPVVWRTIGQGVAQCEPIMQPFREKGLKILRYSPIEAEAPGHIGGDATIRFFKSPETYGGWTGEAAQVLTFSNLYRQRYPVDADDFVRIAEGLPVVLGGIGNEGLPGAVGLTTWQEQIDLYRRSRAYLYGHGLGIPYTLNFIEAWMTGVPIVVYAPIERKEAYFEIDRLITDNVDGYVCRDVDTARARLQALLTDHDLAARIGAAGRASAKRLFSIEHARKQWVEFLASVSPIVNDDH